MTRARNLARVFPDGSGLIPDGNLAGMAASKLTGTVSDANIASVSGSKISGQLLKAQMATGSVLQVVYVSSSSSYTTSATSYQNGPSASITPSSTSNKIAILIDVPQNNGGATQGFHMFALYRDTTQLKDWGSSVGFTGSYPYQASMRQGFNYLDSPATTSSVTYQLKHCSNNGTADQTIYSGTDIILMEIAG